MNRDFHALKNWAALLATVVPLAAAFGGSEINTPPTDRGRVPHDLVTNRVVSVERISSETPTVATVEHGWLGLVISGAPDGAVVERVLTGGGGWQAGIRTGDVILATDKTLLAGLALHQIARLLREPTGSEMELTIKRPGQKDLLKIKPKRAIEIHPHTSNHSGQPVSHFSLQPSAFSLSLKQLQPIMVRQPDLLNATMPSVVPQQPF